MAGDRSPQPPKEAWECRKQYIRTLYLTENWTCVQIQKILEAQGFRVSERQIKNRLSDWKFERKKTPFGQYLAMSVVADHWRSRGVEIEFGVPKREERVIYSTQKVRKECERVRKRYIEKHENLGIPLLPEAEAILQQNNIRCSEKRLVAQQNFFVQFQQLSSAPFTDMPDGTFYSDPACVQVNCAPAKDRRYSFGTSTQQQEMNSLSYESVSCQYINDPREVPQCAQPYSSGSSAKCYTPRSEGTPPSASSVKLEHFSPISTTTTTTPVVEQLDQTGSTISAHFKFSAAVLQDPAFQTCAPSMESKPLLSPICPVKTELGDTTFTVVKSSDRGSLLCRVCLGPHSHPDMDFGETIDSLEDTFPRAKEELPSNANICDEMELDERMGAESHIVTASRWAAPCYHRRHNNIEDAQLEHSKAESMKALQRALEHSNEYILPALNWTILVLGQASEKEELADFLGESCEVIEKHPKLRESYTYDVPFRYALAWARDDDDAMNYWGECLQISRNQIGAIWGKEHPNYFVICYLYAWHLIRQGNYRHAIELLREILPVCEQRKGRHDLLTICCLSVISRAYAEVHDYREAVYYCREAMDAAKTLMTKEDSFKVHRAALKSFRLELLRRHASLIIHLQDYLEAERQMWRVLHIRGQLDGIRSGYTWNVAENLEPLLERRGEKAVWDNLIHFMNNRLQWENSRDWHERTGKDPPPPPSAPPCWWPFPIEGNKAGTPHTSTGKAECTPTTFNGVPRDTIMANG